MKNIKLIIVLSFIIFCAADLCFAGFSEELNSKAASGQQETTVQPEPASAPAQQEAASGEEASEPAQQAAETPSEPASEDTPEKSIQAAGESSGGGYDGSSVVNLSSAFQTDMFTGRAAFNIPIEVPQGRRGMQPNLNLVYQSQGPDTWCGTGWTLDVGSIERSTKKGVPSYDDAKDTFVLNFNGSSAELVNIGTGEYRMENEPHAMKVEFTSGYWVCTDASGTKYYFGQNSASQVADSSIGIFSWQLDKVEDMHKNYMTITYTRDQNELYINRISYAGNSQPGLGDKPTYIVDFELEERDDDITNYRPKFKITTSKRLKSVVVKYADPLSSYSEIPLTCYSINYTYSNKTKKSLISSIKRYSGDRSDSLPEVKFTYNENNQRFGQASAWKTLPTANYRYLMADLNGDGLTDLGYYLNVAIAVSFNFDFSNGNGFDAPLKSYIYSKNYDSYNPFLTYYIHSLEPGDFNGDGKADIITNEVNILTNLLAGAVPFNGTSFDNTQKTERSMGNGQLLIDQYDFGDFNGDGLSDLVRTYINTASIYLSNGSGFNAASCTYTRADPTHSLYFVDCNADGLTDVVDSCNGIWKVALCNGNGFEAAQTWITDFGIGFSPYCMDVNDDGMADAVAIDYARGRWYTAISTGTGFVSSEDFLNNFAPGKVPFSGDYNGDGMLDLGYGDDGNKLYIAKSQGMPNDMLIGIDNSVGGKIDISYKSYNGASNTDVALKDDLAFATWVVDKVTTTDSVTGDSFNATYSYDSGVYNFAEREFRGFGYVKAADHEGNYSETYFCQDDIFKGREYEERICDQTGKCLAKTVTTWQNQQFYSNKINSPYQAQVDSYTYDGDAEKHTRATTSYQLSGDLIISNEAIDEGDIDDANDNKRSVTKYCHNTTAWILNLPYETELFDVTGAAIKRGRVFYDGSTTLGATPAKGLATKQQAWLNYDDTNKDGVAELVPEKWLSTTVEYDNYGHAKKSTDPKGNSIETTYDSVLHQYPLTVKNALNQTQQFTYEYKTGQIKTSTDPNNQKMENKYDSLYRLEKVFGPRDTVDYPSVIYKYDLSTVPNCVTKKVKADYETDHNPVNYLVTYSFSDGFGRPIQVRAPAEPDGATQQQVVSGVVIYDYRGKAKEDYKSYFENYSESYVAPVPTGPKTTYDYDALGRIKIITTQNDDGAPTQSSNSYAGCTVTSFDFNGNKTGSLFDASGKLVEVTEYNEGQTYKTRYEYDGAGNLITVIDSANNTTTIKYDSLGRKLSMTDPDMGTWTYTYDDNGNLITQTDAKGQIISFTYDALNRLTQKRANATTSVDYTYDSGINGLGRLNRVDYSNGYTTFTYDELGRETKSIKSIDGTAYTVERTYDALDRLKTLKYPDSEVLTYTYNTSGALKDIKGLTKTYVSAITYNEQGQMATLTYGNGANGNGVTTTYTYNQYTQRLQKLSSMRGSQATETIQDLEYKFDNVGNIKEIIDRKNTASQTFTYDGLNRLKSALNPSGYQTLNFAYDSIGNMTQKGNAVLRYPVSGPGAVRPHAATSYTLGSTTYALAYDANGNMTSKGDITYEYDTENRLKKVTKPNSSISGTFNIELKAGWNFFSLPCVPAGATPCHSEPQGGEESNTVSISIADALKSIAGKYSQVTRYSTSTGKYESYVGNSAYDQFNAMEYLKGYQIYCDAACTLTITGSSPSAAYGLPLAKGNNLVGVDITNNGKFVSAAFSGIAYSSIKWYNPDTKTLETLDSDDEVYMGRGYWLDVGSPSNYSVSTLTYSTSFTYDGDGGRVKKTVNNVSTIYVGSLFEKTSGVNTRHIYLGDNRICSVTSTGSTSFYHGDHLGSTSDVTDASGNVIQHTEYQPYGEFSVTSATKGDGTDYLFTGQLFDKSTNLYYYGARYYDPELGRFTQADTIVPQPGDPQAFNRYSYCRNNPIIYTDPTGHSWLSKTWKKVKKAVKKAWNFIKRKVLPPVVAFVAAAAFVIATQGMGGPWVIAGISAAATTAALDTGEGRQLVNRVGHEFFDDVLGMPPGMAHSFAYATLEIAGTIVINAGLNAICHPRPVVAYESGEGDNALKVDIKKGFEDYKQTDWAKTPEGKKIMKQVGKAVGDGDVTIADDLPAGTRAQYSNGKIKINSKVSQVEIPGRLAHEGTHMVQDHMGQLKVYDFLDERTAFNAGYAVDKQMNIHGAYNPTDDEIKLWYKGNFDK